MRFLFAWPVFARRYWFFVLAGAGLAACGGAEFSSSAFDGGGTDATVLGDGGTDSAADSAPDARNFCFGSTADLCSDFDDAALPESWSGATADGGSLAENGDASTSPPNSLLSVTPALASGATAQTFVTKRQLPASTGHVELDMRVDDVSFPNASDPQASVTLLVISDADYAVALALHPVASAPYGFEVVEARLADAGTSFTTTGVTQLTVVPQPGDWTHLKADLIVSGTGMELNVQLTDLETDAGPHTQNVPLSPPLLSLGLRRSLSIGIGAIGDVGAAQVRFDSVTWTH